MVAWLCRYVEVLARTYVVDRRQAGLNEVASIRSICLYVYNNLQFVKWDFANHKLKASQLRGNPGSFVNIVNCKQLAKLKKRGPAELVAVHVFFVAPLTQDRSSVSEKG